MEEKVILETHIPGLERVNQGKVRDTYRLDDGRMIIREAHST